LLTEHVELDFAVGLTTERTEQFAREVLGGSAGAEAIHEALRELANVAGGAIKRAGLAEGIPMTIGIPTNDNFFATQQVRTWSASTTSGLRLALGASVSHARALTVRCCELRQGMVLAKDVRSATGLLLVAAGTNLTKSTVQQLARFLDANDRVDIVGSARGTTHDEGIRDHA
jgi:hypothetical protein